MASREGSTDARESTIPEGDLPQGLTRADRDGCSDCSETDSDKLTAHQPTKGQELRALLKVIEESKSDISRQTQLLEEVMKNAVGVWEAASVQKNQTLADNGLLRHTIVSVMKDGHGPVSRGLSVAASRQAARTSGTAVPAAVEASSRTSSATQAVYSTELSSRCSQLASLRASLSITSTEVTQRLTSAAFRSNDSTGVPDLRADPGAWFDYWLMAHTTSSLTSTALAGLRFRHVFEGLIGSSCCKISTDKLIAVHACLGVMWYRVGLGQDGNVTRAEFLKPEGLASTVATFFRPRKAATRTAPLLPGHRQRFRPRAHPPPEVYELVN